MKNTPEDFPKSKRSLKIKKIIEELKAISLSDGDKIRVVDKIQLMVRANLLTQEEAAIIVINLTDLSPNFDSEDCIFKFNKETFMEFLRLKKKYDKNQRDKGKLS